MLSGVGARLAAILLTVMFAIFGLLVHAPLLFQDPQSRLNWVMNAQNLALTGADWVLADSLRSAARQAQAKTGVGSCTARAAQRRNRQQGTR